MGWAIESIFSIQHYTILSINSVLTVKTVCLYMVGNLRNLASGAYLVSQSGGGGKSSTFPIFSQISIFFSYFSSKFQNLLIFFLILTLWMGVIGPPGKALATPLSCTLHIISILCRLYSEKIHPV